MSMVPEVSKLLGPDGKPMVNMIEKQGASAAKKAAQSVVKSIKNIPAWMKENPVKALALETVNRGDVGGVQGPFDARYDVFDAAENRVRLK